MRLWSVWLISCCGAALAAQQALAADAPPFELGLEQSISMAVRNNVTSKLAKAKTEAAKGRVLQAAAELLPRLTGSLSQQRVFRTNLAAMGFSGSGLGPLIGPYNVFDARIQLVQTLFDFSAWHRFQAARASRTLVQSMDRLAEEQVSAAAVLSYVEALRSQEAIRAAQAGLQLARELVALTEEQRKAGTATGLDLARVKTREAEERLRVLEAETSFSEAVLGLKHVVGLPLARPIMLQASLSFSPADIPKPEEAAASAAQDRLELKIAQERARLEGYSLKAARGQRLPFLGFNGEMASSGNKPDANARLVGSAGLRLSLPLFDEARLSGKAREAQASLSEAEALLAEARVQVEEDVLLSIEKLQAAGTRVETSRQAVRLAENELQMARDRFSAGVGDNIELVNAQAILARTQDASIAALARHHIARVNLALAMGRMREFK